MRHPIIITFAIYFAAIFTISFIASKRTNNLADFILGGRSLSGSITALGAGASDMSSWLLLALPGAVYSFGISEIWLPLGLSIGAFLNWQFVAKRLRVYTEKANDSLTIPAYLDNRFQDNQRFLRPATAIVILIFFTFYAASGFVGGALLFQQTFNFHYHTALIIGVVIIMTYTCIGGFLAVNWVDFFQGSLMFVTLLTVPLLTYYHLHVQYHTEIFATIQHVNPPLLHSLHDVKWYTIISLLGWGLGYFGQPHILVRFMAIKDPHETPKARFICMTWMILSLYGAIFTGLFGIAYFAGSPLAKPETVFLQFAKILFDPWAGGILLAAVLSAIMSTISAQLLASSSALTEDIYCHFIRKNASPKELIFVSRITILCIAIIAFVLAYNPHSTILNLVSYAWAGLGGSFGPLILLSLYWPRMTRRGAIGGLIIGAITVLLWEHFKSFGGIFHLYSLIPAFILNCATIISVSLWDKEPDSTINETFSLVLNSL